MVQQQSKPDEIVVFSILRDSQCSECGDELMRGDLLKKEAEKALCLTCADLAHLVFLPPGNTALTRRASKYSTLRAIVLRFSQSRKRYERQGILVEIAALQQAESECLADAELRDRRREREAIRRNQQDAAYIAEFTRHICSRYPACPVDQAAVIADHACQKYSGRVGRSAAAKEFAPEAIDLAVIAHIRHVHTRYDELLASGWERYAAREAIAAEVQEVLKNWSAPMPDSDVGFLKQQMHWSGNRSPYVYSNYNDDNALEGLAMVVEYVNRKGRKHYLHEGKTKTGKPMYFFSMKSEGNPANAIPEGYEIYEHPNAQVFVRKIPPQIITPEEIETIRTGVKKYAKIANFIVDVKGKNIIIYLPDQNVDALMELASFAHGGNSASAREVMARSLSYSPMMQFVLEDAKTREFVVQRWCFRGSVDDWISLGSSNHLDSLVKSYGRHLGKESFYNLTPYGII